MDKEAKNYEIGFLLSSEDGYRDLIGAMKACQATILNEGQISRAKLAYPVKKENFAYFGYLYFSINPGDIENLNSWLKKNAGVLRFFITRQEVVKEGDRNLVGRSASVQTEHLLERPKFSQPKDSATVSSREISKKTAETRILSNEDLEKKLEEILK